MTLPPTAAVGVLHTGVMAEGEGGRKGGKREGKAGERGGFSMSTSSSSSSSSSSSVSKRLFSLFRGSGEREKMLVTPSENVSSSTSGLASSSSSTSKSNFELHSVLIPSSVPSVPSLYYSRVEALSGLGTHLLGKLRSRVRVYWGCMYWSRRNLERELEEGLWFPVTVSPEFFRTVESSAQGSEPAGETAEGKMRRENEENAAQAPIPQPDEDPKLRKRGKKIFAKKRSSQKESKEVIVRTELPHNDTRTHFPTAEQLQMRKQFRSVHQGHDTQRLEPIFPPEPPMCRREPLWDQIMYALGGEYRSLSCYGREGAQFDPIHTQEIILEDLGDES